MDPRVKDRLKEIKVCIEDFQIRPYCQRMAVQVIVSYPCAHGLMTTRFRYYLQVTDKAVAVGFGISTPEHVRQV